MRGENDIKDAFDALDSFDMFSYFPKLEPYRKTFEPPLSTIKEEYTAENKLSSTSRISSIKLEEDIKL
jgi:hypothetical protein